MTSQWARLRLKSPVSRFFTQPFIQAQIKGNTKPRVVGLCAGNSPVTGEFPAQMASNAENVSIWWRHHVVTDDMASRASDHPMNGIHLFIDYYLFRSINRCCFLWRMISSEYGEIIKLILSWLWHANAFALMALVKRINRSPVDSLHKWPAMLKFDIVLLFNERTVKQTVELPSRHDAHVSSLWFPKGPGATITLQVRRTDYIALLTSQAGIYTTWKGTYVNDDNWAIARLARYMYNAWLFDARSCRSYIVLLSSIHSRCSGTYHQIL